MNGNTAALKIEATSSLFQLLDQLRYWYYRMLMYFSFLSAYTFMPVIFELALQLYTVYSKPSINIWPLFFLIAML